MICKATSLKDFTVIVPREARHDNPLVLWNLVLLFLEISQVSLVKFSLD